MTLLEKAPPELINFVKSGRCSIFLGAGFSRSLGLPLWSDISVAIGNELRERFGSDIDPVLSRLDSLQIAQMYVDVNGGSRIPLNDLLDKQFGRAKLRFDDQHVAVSQLPIRTLLTTNWDRAIETAFIHAVMKLNVIWRNDEVASWGTSDRQLLKLHGDIDDKKSLVFTHEDYLEYVDQHRPLEDLARSALLTKAVLFIGFSLQDPHFQSLFSQLQYLPRKSKYPAYAVFIRQPKELLEYWSSRGFSVIALDDVTETPESQLKQFMRELVRQTSAIAISSVERIRLLVRETANHLKYAGPNFTIRIRAALGPFGSPEPDPSLPVFSDASDQEYENDRLEWDLHKLVREYIQRGSSVKLICAPGADGLLRKYSREQARRRLASFVADMQRMSALEVVYDQGNLERNYFILGDSVFIESRKEHSGQKLYSFARLIAEREQVDTVVAQFDKEFDILNRLSSLEIAEAELTPREHVLRASVALLDSLQGSEANSS